MNNIKIPASAAIISKNEEHCIKKYFDSIIGKFYEDSSVKKNGFSTELIENHLKMLTPFTGE